MATTWAGTADNQLLTYDAIKDGYNSGVYGLQDPVLFPTGKRIGKKTFIHDNITSLDQATAVWTALGNNQCPTKSEVYQALSHKIQIYASRGNTQYDLKVELKNGSTVVETFLVQPVNVTTCTYFGELTNWANYNYTIDITITWSVVNPSTQKYAYNSTDCSSGTSTANTTKTFTLTSGGLYIPIAIYGTLDL